VGEVFGLKLMAFVVLVFDDDSFFLLVQFFFCIGELKADNVEKYNNIPRFMYLIS
jgi:hypothetical protein